MSKIGKSFLKSYSGNYSRWYNDVTLVYKLGQYKGLKTYNIDDMLMLRNIGERFEHNENIEIRLFGSTIKETAEMHIATSIEFDKRMASIRKAHAHHKAKRG